MKKEEDEDFLDEEKRGGRFCVKKERRADC